MELRHLRYFEALAGCLNFTRAAERVHVTQSTLSHQIKQLEEEIGRPLFDRVGKRVVMTEQGEIFLTFVQKALKEIDAGLGVLKEEASHLTGQVRIGAAHTFNIGLIPACIEAFLQRYPTVKVVVEELPADLIASKIASGDLDIGIAYDPGNSEQLWFEPLYNEEMVLIVSADHPFAERKRVRMVELHQQKLVLLPVNFSTRELLDNYFRACGAEPSIVVEMNTIAPMLDLVSRGTIGSIVSRNAVPSSSPVKIIPIESPTPIRTPGILWKQKIARPPQVTSFAAIVRKICLKRSQRQDVR
jgi:LysR family cyn operon transcriptional activator